MIFLLLAFLLIDRSAGAAQQKATVFGTPTANVRAGTGVEQALITTLKEGDPVVIEKLEGDWYLVNTADGKKGYVHKSLMKLAAETPPPPIPALPAALKPIPAQPATPKPTVAETKAPVQEVAVAPAPAPPVRAPQAKPAEAKSQSILQMMEGRETEVRIGLLIAALAFVIGWLCGGSFYRRRERKSRYKLRF